MLKDKGIEIIAADSPGTFVDDTPTATFVRQVLGAVAELDKAMTVAKLPVSASGAKTAGARVEHHYTSAIPRPCAWPSAYTAPIP